MSNDNKPAAAQEAVAWSKTKPTAEGAYYVRGFNLFQLAQYEALVQVRTHHFDGEPAPELVCNIHESTSNADMDDWSPIVEMSEDFEWLGPLVAAPVAAAPVELQSAARFAADVLSELYAKYQHKIGPFASQAQRANVMLGAALRASTPAAPADLDAHGLRALDACIADLRRLLELAPDYDLDVMQMQSLETAIESMQLQKVMSTPAAPGVDLVSDILTDLSNVAGRWVVEAAGASADAQNECAMQMHDAIEPWSNRLQLGDASPKGGSDAQMVPYQRALDLIGDAYNAGTHGIGYSQQAMELYDALQATSAEGMR